MSKHYKIQKMENMINTSPPPNPWQLLIWFLSLWICLFWTFHIDGTIQYVIFFSLAYFIWYNVVKVHPLCRSVYHSLFLRILLHDVERLLSIYSYYQILAVFPKLYNTSLSPSYTQQFVPPTPPTLTLPSPPARASAGLFSGSVSLLFSYCH